MYSKKISVFERKVSTNGALHTCLTINKIFFYLEKDSIINSGQTKLKMRNTIILLERWQVA